ncbi:hypothetical protein [Glycomyces salinus]|uniref:hypothetical protein n=1 Tax=Glycomyces salinus TaxID=980294 RepID=UPI0018EAE503|nr:hypothetical protein [Glycomyces salinus]
MFGSGRVIADPEQMLRTLVHELRSSGWRPSAARLERVSKRIDFIAMRRRLEREAKLGVNRSRAPWSV